MSAHRSCARADLLGAVAIALVAAAVYGDSLAFPFVYDDVSNIVQNPGIRLRWDAWSSVRGLRLWSPTPRPVANGSFALCHAVFGLESWGYRLVNVGIHVLASLCVVGVVRRWSRSFDASGRLEAGSYAWAGWIAGLVFASHPLATQSVTYVVQRMTSLSTLLYVAALWVWLVGSSRSVGARWRWRSGAVVLWVLSLGSKEIAATWPVVVWLWEWGYGSGRSDLRGYVRRTGWMWGAAAVLFGVLLWAYGGFDGASAGSVSGGYARKPFTWWERWWTEPRVWWRYVGLWVWPLPWRLSVIHAVEMSSGPFGTWGTAVSWLGWVGALAGGAWAWRRASTRWLGWVIGWFWVQQWVEGTVLPLEPMYEHRTYLPSVGLCAGVGYGAVRLRGWAQARGMSRAAAGRALALVVASVVAALALLAHARNQVWRSPDALWSDALAKAPGHPRPHVNYGMALAAEGRHDAALASYARAAAIDPRFQEAWHDRGVSLAALGRDAEARAAFERAVELEPRDGLAHRALANVLFRLGELDAGADHLETAARLAGGPHLYAQLAHARARQGRTDEALRWLAVSLSMDRAQPARHAFFAELALHRGDLARAAAHLDESLALRDDAGVRAARARVAWAAGEWGDAIALAERAHADATGRAAVPAAATLAWMRATAPDDALRDAARALEVARRPELASDPRLLEAAAAALAQLGAFDEAALALERAVALSREAGQSALVDRWRRDLVDVRQRRAPIESATSARERVVSGAWSPVPEPIESLSTRGEPTGPARGSRPPLAR